ncbi:VOC family protein [Promicromonospora citrea]|uniref:Similarity with Glyoxalase/Bleomycin resistance protein n=1 Tax=Promicromonospora citrea TaxID=43677 RepID=A0A8H9GGD1_9MICO|nr:VOC family protein [Promicromonospora citrea]NNH52330.1 glyoxalase [Promicromonospora citrea]GGM24032.1 similarity with Glyoxalase/Bleomycin resistance protein [Promicromonospora citrea]
MSTGLWVTLTYRDADAGLAWLQAVGFTERAVYRDDADPAVVQHAELDWPAGGGVMLGTYRPRPGWPDEAGTGSAYAVTDDVDGTYRAALAAGGSSLQEPADQDYGGRSCTVRDVDGNLWSFGSYRGEE